MPAGTDERCVTNRTKILDIRASRAWPGVRPALRGELNTAERGPNVNTVVEGERAAETVKDGPCLRGAPLFRLKVPGTRGDRRATLEDFFASLHVSASSLETYRKRLNHFFAWLDGRGIARPGREHIAAWRDELASGERSPVTVSSYLTVVRQFFRWAHLRGLCEDIAEDVRGPAVERAFRDDTLTSVQVQEMLDGIDRRSVEGLRDYALLSLLVTCGLGYSEAARAKVGDLEASEGAASLRVRDADGAARVRVPAFVADALQSYWNARGFSQPDAPLFAGVGTRKRQPMSVRTIGRAVRDIARRAGIDGFTPNSLRHTAVRLAAQSGERIEDVKRFARHRYIGTTSLYGGQAAGPHSCGETIAAAIF